MLLMQTAAGGPRHYESETVWPGRSLDGVRGGGPRGHSRYVPLSYCGEGGEGEGTRQNEGTKGEEGKMQRRTDGRGKGERGQWRKNKNRTTKVWKEDTKK